MAGQAGFLLKFEDGMSDVSFYQISTNGFLFCGNGDASKLAHCPPFGQTGIVLFDEHIVLPLEGAFADEPSLSI